jgi:hypothetical protein
MRKSDKKHNIAKVNLLAEQRYLESKSLISESLQEVDGTPIGVNGNHNPINEYGQSNEYDLSNDQNMDKLVSYIASYFSSDKTNDKGVANDNKAIVYNTLIKKIFELSPVSSMNVGNNQNEYYTNNPEMMDAFLKKVCINDFTLINK